ncbi:unnamed protein product [Urochloa humidicola]
MTGTKKLLLQFKVVDGEHQAAHQSSSSTYQSEAWNGYCKPPTPEQGYSDDVGQTHQGLNIEELPLGS